MTRGLPTSSVNVNDKISDVLNMSKATKTGVVMTGDMYDILDGLGIAINQPMGLAIIAEGKNTGCMIMQNTEIVIPRAGSIMPIVQKLGLCIADLTKGVSTKSNVVVQTVESMKTKCLSTPLPKNTQL